MKLRIASLSLLTLLCLTLAVVPAVATDITLYSNGPATPSDFNAWPLGPEVTNSFYISASSTITAFSVGIWVDHGSHPVGVEAYIGTTPFGQELGFVGGYFSSWTFDFINAHGSLCPSPGCDVYTATMTFPGISVAPGGLWLTLQAGTASDGGFFGWDQNGGVGCFPATHCPSTAYLYPGIGILSEDPDIIGHLNATTPEPGSVMLFGSGILGLAGVLRRKLNI